MNKAIYITGTGTDIGKTYVAGEVVAAIQGEGFDTAYYKPVLSGSDNILESDAGYVRKRCNLEQEPLSMVTTMYHDAVSPHLAAARVQEGVDLDIINADFGAVSMLHDVTVVEGCGGIICPLTMFADDRRIMQEDVIHALDLDCLIVADAGLGTINATVLTIEYMRARGFKIEGIILNRFVEADEMHQDNLAMIEKLGDVDVVATVAEGGTLKVRKPFFVLEV